MRRPRRPWRRCCSPTQASPLFLDPRVTGRQLDLARETRRAWRPRISTPPVASRTPRAAPSSSTPETAYSSTQSRHYSAISRFYAFVRRSPRCDSPLVLDALCGGGVRAIRYALEVPGARLHANDSSERCIAATWANAEASGATLHEATQSDASSLMMVRHRRYDAVDLDPCGSVAELLPAAVTCLVDGGLLCATATDLGALSGRFGDGASARYESQPLRCSPKVAPEMAVRTLLACAQRAAAAEGRRAEPLLVIAVAGFYCRVVVRITDEASSPPPPIGHVVACTACGAAAAEPPGRAAPLVCAQCGGSELERGGPVWLGPTASAPFVRALVGACRRPGRGAALAGNLGAAAGGGGGGGGARRARAAADPAARRMPAARLPPAPSRESHRGAAPRAAIAPPPRTGIRRRCRWRKAVLKVRRRRGRCFVRGRRLPGRRRAAAARRRRRRRRASGCSAAAANRWIRRRSGLTLRRRCASSSDASAATTAAPPTRAEARASRCGAAKLAAERRRPAPIRARGARATTSLLRPRPAAAAVVVPGGEGDEAAADRRRRAALLRPRGGGAVGARRLLGGRARGSARLA